MRRQYERKQTNFYDLDKLKEIPIQEVLRDFYGIESTPKGAHRAFCDIRGEKTPSCCLYLDTNSYCDFGDSNRGGNVINLVQQLSNVGFAEAAELLAQRYGIASERREVNAFPTSHEFKRINIEYDLATKNFDFDLDKYSLEKTKEFSQKYAMSVKELSEKYPNVYHNMLRSRAVTHIDFMRNNYYRSLYLGHLLCSDLGTELSDQMVKELQEDIKELDRMENIINRAITDKKLLPYKAHKYDVKTDLLKILNGQIEYQTGNIDYVSLKAGANKANKNLFYQKEPFNLFYQKVPFNDFMDFEKDLNFEFAAFVNGKNKEVNIITRADNRKALLDVLNSHRGQVETVKSNADMHVLSSKEKAPPHIQEQKYNTVVVNLFAGPGAGKTTCAWEIASSLKKKGVITEYVSEVAKEYAWDNDLEMLDGSLKNQRQLLEEQDRRVQRLMGKVEVIVTDSPILLNMTYLKEQNEEFQNDVLNRFGRQNNFNVFVERGQDYETAGRIHDYADAVRIDSNIENLLKDNDFYYKKYPHAQIKRCTNNIYNYVQRANGRQIKKTVGKEQDFISQYCRRVAQNQRLLQKELEVIR